MTLKQRLIADLGLTEADFSTHESDLYVIDVQGKVYDWLKANYHAPNQCRTFIGDGTWAGRSCVEIPFGYMDEFVANKRRHAPDVDEFGATAEDRRQLAAHGIAWGD